MSHIYYVTYSAQTSKGSCVGRSSVTRATPIKTFDDVEATEAAVIANSRKTEPTMTSLFLTFWTELAAAGDTPAVTPGDRHE